MFILPNISPHAMMLMLYLALWMSIYCERQNDTVLSTNQQVAAAAAASVIYHVTKMNKHEVRVKKMIT